MWSNGGSGSGFDPGANGTLKISNDSGWMSGKNFANDDGVLGVRMTIKQEHLEFVDGGVDALVVSWNRIDRYYRQDRINALVVDFSSTAANYENHLVLDRTITDVDYPITVKGGLGDDTIINNMEDDAFVSSSAASVTLYSHKGSDKIQGSDLPETIYGGTGDSTDSDSADEIMANGGADVVFGGTENSAIILLSYSFLIFFLSISIDKRFKFFYNFTALFFISF